MCSLAMGRICAYDGPSPEAKETYYRQKRPIIMQKRPIIRKKRPLVRKKRPIIGKRDLL